MEIVCSQLVGLGGTETVRETETDLSRIQGLLVGLWASTDSFPSPQRSTPKTVQGPKTTTPTVGSSTQRNLFLRPNSLWEAQPFSSGLHQQKAQSPALLCSLNLKTNSLRWAKKKGTLSLARPHRLRLRPVRKRWTVCRGICVPSPVRSLCPSLASPPHTQVHPPCLEEEERGGSPEEEGAERPFPTVPLRPPVCRTPLCLCGCGKRRTHPSLSSHCAGG
mmetsp:Transcript_16391/g.33340  ORF Transcript_16391/g.33340 Transcript_16391/m.33340 type:complete len:220 (-) Transcript_16391:366-1025(-)